MSEELEVKELGYLLYLTEQKKLADAALNHYVGFLGQTYRLGPNDSISLSGEIVRQQRSEETPL